MPLIQSAEVPILEINHPVLNDRFEWENAAKRKVPGKGKFKVVELDYFDYTDCDYGDYSTLEEARAVRERLTGVTPQSPHSLVKYFIYDVNGNFVE
jgi:hypothetical protein